MSLNDTTIHVFDFFSGCGGICQGFKQAGLDIVFALDNDVDAGHSIKLNFPNTHVEPVSVEEMPFEVVKNIISSHACGAVLFAGCAPCQPFSKQNTCQPKDDPRKSLLDRFGDLIKHFAPDYLFIENVPGIQKIGKYGSPISMIKHLLDTMGYFHDSGVIAAQKYGVPQRRSRYVLIGSKHGSIKLPEPTHGKDKGQSFSTIREWIKELPPIRAGEQHPELALHRSASLTKINLRRIEATPINGGRNDWPKELVLRCHNNGYVGHTDVYGRMKWDDIAPALTTRCISLSNGRFGHPDQNRAISVLEAARLQTFPLDYKLHGAMTSQARQIGNAVPVLLAETFGEIFIEHHRQFYRGE